MSTDLKPWAAAVAQAKEPFITIAAEGGNLVTYQKEAAFAIQALQANESLRECTAISIRNSIINVASVGLSLSPALKLAYLVPRKGKAYLDISYRGLVKIAMDSGAVLAAKAELVYANDKFEYVDGFTPPIHKFNPFDSIEKRGEIIGVYVLAKLASGITQVETLSREEIEKIKAVSKASNGPWVEWFEEMVKKSAIKRATKMWPTTERLSKAEVVLNEHQGAVNIQTPPAEPTPEAAAEIDAQAEAIANLKEGIRDRLKGAVTRDVVDAAWTETLTYCNDSQDREFYDEIKPIVASLRKTLPKAEHPAAAE